MALPKPHTGLDELSEYATLVLWNDDVWKEGRGKLWCVQTSHHQIGKRNATAPTHVAEIAVSLLQFSPRLCSMCPQIYLSLLLLYCPYFKLLSILVVQLLLNLIFLQKSTMRQPKEVLGLKSAFRAVLKMCRQQGH